MSSKKQTPARASSRGSRTKSNALHERSNNIPEEREEQSAEIPSRAVQPRRRDLYINSGDLTETARQLRDAFAEESDLFDRGSPTRLVRDQRTGLLSAKELNADDTVHAAHEITRPFKLDEYGKPHRVTLPDRVARLYLSLPDGWRLPSLNGISLAPTLRPCGSIQLERGYDPVTGIWFDCDLMLPIPPMVLMADAQAALARIRHVFRTFAFADAPRTRDSELGIDVVDLSLPPALDESSFLVALLTAVSRPSLHLAPAILFQAPTISGAGTGKGMLVRAICQIAFGIEPSAFPPGHSTEEMDKRIATVLMEGQSVLYLDNANNIEFVSNTLASAITERPVKIRTLGSSKMRTINSSTLIVLTGNGISLSEDLVRRFLVVLLDARTESPEERQFPGNFLPSVRANRVDILTDLLSIWRFGRQHADNLCFGKPLGSFDQWCRWVRDPLLALGVRDPVDRIRQMKADDPARDHIISFFEKWEAIHRNKPMLAADLDESVKHFLDPHGRSRQFFGAQLNSLVGTRLGGFLLTKSSSPGKWGKATYRLVRTTEEN